MQKELKCGKAVAIVDTKGGELISYKYDGKDILWIGDGKYWTGHAPCCFPYVSALKEDKVKFEGKEFSMVGKHGIVRKREFEEVNVSDTKAEYVFVSTDETKALYPYDFKLNIIHEISEDGFKTTYKVLNTGDKTMTFCIGGHPGLCTQGSIEDWTLEFEKDEDCALYYTDEKSLFSKRYTIDRKLSKVFPLKYEDYDKDAIIATDINSRVVKLTNKDGHGMVFDYSGFNVLVLWTPPKAEAPFIALEPWNGLPADVDEDGNFENKPYAITLEAGKEYTVGYSIKLF